MNKFLTALCAFAIAAVSAPAQAPLRLDVKTGLWQSTVVMHMKGKLPLSEDELAKLPPDQRARIETAIQANIDSAAQPHTSKYCLTEEKLKKGLAFDDEKNPNCKRTVLEHSSSSVKVEEVCSDENGTSTVHMEYTAKDPENVSGAGHVVVSRGGNTMTSDMTMTGKWVGANCAGVE